MKRTLLLLGVFLLATAVHAGKGGGTLSIRLVEAGNEGQGVGKGLGDVGQLLQENLPFKSFQLRADKSVSLPADGSVGLAAGFVARCSGDADKLSVIIEQKGKPGKLESTVSLRKGKPLILGGFPSDGGKMIVILLLR